MRRAYFILGMFALSLGVVGLFLPLLPTVPFLILAAYCFGRSNPAFEQRLLQDPRFGPHIRAWRERGAISRRGKLLAVTMLACSGVLGLLLLEPPWSAAPAVVALLCGSWIATRPST